MAKDVHVEKRVEIPEGVRVEIDGMRVKVEGPKGSLERDFSHARGVLLRLEGGEVVVESYFANARKRALVGTIA
ncbi:MAG: 50S ribosomal protein L6, partial [Desulfurococcales archaeon]|nr:50S ribosomal protein L6 [Desulfurococcales archaeon]